MEIRHSELVGRPEEVHQVEGVDRRLWRWWFLHVFFLANLPTLLYLSRWTNIIDHIKIGNERIGSDTAKSPIISCLIMCTAEILLLHFHFRPPPQKKKKNRENVLVPITLLNGNPLLLAQLPEPAFYSGANFPPFWFLGMLFQLLQWTTLIRARHTAYKQVRPSKGVTAGPGGNWLKKNLKAFYNWKMKN